MPYIPLHPMKQFDFQINRILTYGEEACDFNEIKGAVPQIVDLDSWYGSGSVWENKQRRTTGISMPPIIIGWPSFFSKSVLKNRKCTRNRFITSAA
ncbi:hypothetical protein ABEV00_29310 [Paenibacillus thiaminolyticus]|uniref:hypothetical protein n=1 Tax=Paenibacillus thiaminolyticus TaxID=49283 RepID=UPI003D2A98D7